MPYNPDEEVTHANLIVASKNAEKGKLFLGNIQTLGALLKRRDRAKAKCDWQLKAENQVSEEKSFVKDRKIGAILTLISKEKMEIENVEIMAKEAEKQHFCIDIVDLENEDIMQHFEKTFNFIEEHLQTTNVLVHCMAGVSRSATIVVAYLMRKHGWSLDRSLRAVKDKRPQIRPNDGFLEQLILFESRLRKSGVIKPDGGTSIQKSERSDEIR